MAKKSKVKKPSGLKITRSKAKFTFTWKQGGKYSSQKIQIGWTMPKKKVKWGKAISIGKAVKKYVVTAKGGNLRAAVVRFRVWGNKGGKATSKPFKLNNPERPKVTQKWAGENNANGCIFTWSAKDKPNQPLTKFVWESVLCKSNTTPNWGNADKSDPNPTSSGSKTFTDSQVHDGTWYRYFRVKAVGLHKSRYSWPSEDSKTIRHVYTDPLAPQNLKLLSANPIPQNRPREIQILLQWESPTAANKEIHPIDYITAEYCIANPTMNMVPVEGSTWNVAVRIKDTGEAGNTNISKYKGTSTATNKQTSEVQNVSFKIPQTLSYDQCAWLKIVAHYSDRNTESEAILFRYINDDNKKESGLISKLTPPTITKLQKNSNYTTTVNISNSGNVPGAYCAITYINPKDTTGYNNQVIKVLEPRDYGRDVSFQCPPWQDENDVSFNIYTFIPADGAIQFTNTLFDVDEVLRLSGEFVTGDDYGIAEYNDEYYFAMLSTSQKQSLTELYKYDEEEGEWGSRPVYESKNDGKDPHPPTSGSQYYNAWNAAWANKDTDTHGNPIVDNNLGDVSYVEVTPKGDENPSEEGWYEREFDEETQEYVYFETEDTTVDPLKTYYRERVINLYEFDAIMRSGKITEASPNYPTKVQAKAVEPDGTIQVTWSNDWEEASGVEVSWADHADALYSTNGPSTFEVLSAQQNKLNISGLEMGKIWYIWVRMYELEGENKHYGPYSDMQTVELVTAPVVPILSTSPANGVITETQPITLSWVFTTNDNTNQASAELRETDELGNDMGFLAKTTTDQNIDIRPDSEDINWDSGSVHWVTVRVKSETGLESPSSEPVRIEIADPVSVEIDKDLTDLTKSWHPQTYSGSSISITNTSGEKELNEMILNLPYNSEGYNSFAVMHNEDEHAKECVFVDNLDLRFYGGSFNYFTGELTFLYADDGTLLPEEDIIVEDLGEDNISLEEGENVFDTTDGSLSIKTADNQNDVWVLERMPMHIKINGAGDGDNTILIIQRAEDYPMDRPDERDTIGYAGETIFDDSHPGDEIFEITIEDGVYGLLDDGARYIIRAFVQDTHGQIAEADQLFEIHWAEQAVVPGDDDVDVTIEDGAAYIKVSPPEGSHISYVEATPAEGDNPLISGWYELVNGVYILSQDIFVDPNKTYYIYNGDTVDIYRLSADKPELLVSGARFYDDGDANNTTYVDPYPTIGRWGGYRVVIITANGDYIASDDGYELPAWNDYDGSIDTKFQLINFDGNELPLKYNVSLDNSWNKLFTTTHYLGGSIEGDWMAGVERTGSLKGVNLDDYDPEGYDMFRELAEYTGICNVRTIDGTNIKANIAVSDSSTFNQVGHPHDITLNLTKVDNADPDGMTLAGWLNVEE